MKAKDLDISHDEVLRLVSYDPSTGHFTRLVRVANRHQIGDRADFPGDRYTFVALPGGRVRAHRLAWFYMTGVWPANDIDHIDRCKGNNIWGNLREATRSQNLSNKSHGPDRGVNWSEARGKWHAKVKHMHKMYQKRFDSKEEALAFVAELRAKFFGEFH